MVRLSKRECRECGLANGWHHYGCLTEIGQRRRAAQVMSLGDRVIVAALVMAAALVLVWLVAGVAVDPTAVAR